MKKSIIAAVAASLVAAPTSLLVATAPVAGAWCNPWFPASCYLIPQVPQYHPQMPQVRVPQYHPPVQVPQYHPPAQVPHQVPQYHPPSQMPHQVPQQHPQVPQQHPQVPQQHPQVPQQQHPQVPQQHPEVPQQQHPQAPQQQHPGQPQQHPGQSLVPQQHPGQPQHPLMPQQQHPQVPQQHPGINGPGKTALVAAPKGVGAEPKAIAAAKAAPAVRIKPASPPKSPKPVDFNHEVQKVISRHGHNLDVVKAGNHSLVHPRHWDYIDYDVYHRPIL